MMDILYAATILPKLLNAALLTVGATILGMAMAVSLGAAIAIGEYGGPRSIRVALGAIVNFIKTTPLLIQLFFVFYLLPFYGLRLPAFVTGILVLGVHYASYLANVYRGGIESIASGQWEAARALGLRPWATWTKVIGPQVVEKVLPQVGNYFVSMYKDTAVLATIGVMELLGQALYEAGKSYRYYEPLLLVGLLFLLISFVSSLALRRLERNF